MSDKFTVDLCKSIRLTINNEHEFHFRTIYTNNQQPNVAAVLTILCNACFFFLSSLHFWLQRVEIWMNQITTDALSPTLIINNEMLFFLSRLNSNSINSFLIYWSTVFLIHIVPQLYILFVVVFLISNKMKW